MQVDVGTIIAIALPSAGVIVWFVRLEGQVKAVDRQRIADLASVRQQRESDDLLTTERFTNIQRSLGAINTKLDGLEAMKSKVDQIRTFIGTGGPFQGTP